MLAAHVGLAIGTLSRHLDSRPEFRPLVDSWLNFDTVGLYLLSERGHGLDAFNIETTATLTEQGYILHTPREEAAKYEFNISIRSLWSDFSDFQVHAGDDSDIRYPQSSPSHGETYRPRRR